MLSFYSLHEWVRLTVWEDGRTDSSHDGDSWGHHPNHHKHSKNVEEDGAETQPLFYCRRAAKLWKLVQEIYEAASADQAHLELKGF